MQAGDKLKETIILARQTIWQYQLEDYTASSLKMITKSLNVARNELVTQLNQGGVRYIGDQRDALLNELNDLSLGIQYQLTNNIADAATVAGDATLKETGRILSFDGAVENFNFVSLAPAQLKSMVMTTPIGGHLLNDWVKRSFDSTLGMDEAILTGYLKGEGIAKMKKRLVDGFGLMKREAETLARTYIAEANNQAAKAVYDANSDIIDKEEWNAHLEVNTRNGRGTCMRCAGLDGRKYPLESSHIRPPLHPRCRCFMVPVTKSYRELGLDIDELKDIARPYTTKKGKKILQAGTFEGDFEGFLKKQGYAYQKDFLGPNRLRMWKDGTIKFDDMVDDAGNIRLLAKGKDGGYVGLVGAAKRKQFKMSKNIKWAGLDISQQEAITRAFNKIQSKTDIDLKLQGVRQYTQKELEEGKALTVADMSGGILRVNPKLFNNNYIKESNYRINTLIKAEARLENLNNRIKETGFSVSEKAKIYDKIQRQKDKIKAYKKIRYGVAEDMDDIIIHELGHEINDNLTRTSKYGDDFLIPSLLRQKGIDFNSTLQSQILQIAKSKGGAVSEYATTNDLEYFAESWLSYVKGETGIVDNRLIDIFKKITGK